jgi:hypothetical protein
VRHSDGVHVRVVDGAGPAAGARPVPPRLEDAYLYLIAGGPGAP